MKLFIGLMAGGGVLYLIALFIDLEIRFCDYNGEKVKNRERKIYTSCVLFILSSIIVISGYIILFTLG